MDTDYQAGAAGLKYASEKGLAIVIMEPLKGGKLAKTPPVAVQEIWNQSSIKRTPAEWALRWVWNHPEVSVVLSGMNTPEQIEENLNTASEAMPNSLPPSELRLFEEVQKSYRLMTQIDCTACGYCQPCPSGVDIPGNFALYNEAHMYDELATSRFAYGQFYTPETRASACTECGQCEEACPQTLSIRTYLRDVHQALGV